MSVVNRKYMMIGILLIMPAVIIYAVFMAYPLFRTLYLSFTNWGGFGPTKIAGIGNYTKIFKDKTFILSLKNTLYFAIGSAIFSVLLGILMAWLNLFLRRYTGQVSRTVLFMPSVIAPTITGLLFLFIFTEDIGLINNILRNIGLGRFATAWLTNSGTVKNAVLVQQTWRQFGLVMVLVYAGLQGVPTELIECARIDGAKDGQIFRKILLPLIKPQIELATMFTTLGGLKIYDSVVSLTGGGPARQTVVLPMWIIENAFTYSKFGYASAMCIFFVLLVLVFILILRRLFRGETYEY